jgi:DNA-binding XRE family transcriptional regulator
MHVILIPILEINFFKINNYSFLEHHIKIGVLSMSIGKNIKTSRKKANLTQAELAQLIGLSSSAIRMYELIKEMPANIY